MNEERREQIKWMLTDLVDNMSAPTGYPSHADFKRDWLNAVAEVAAEQAKLVL